MREDHLSTSAFNISIMYRNTDCSSLYCWKFQPLHLLRCLNGWLSSVERTVNRNNHGCTSHQILDWNSSKLSFGKVYLWREKRNNQFL
jgi:hypothetical protein